MPLWLVFDKLKDEYGPVVYLNMMGQDIVVLNTKASATELLERRSSIYSDRPRGIVAEYLGSHLTLPFARYGKLWQVMRRASHAVLNTRVSNQYQSVQTDEAVLLTHSLLCDTSSSIRAKLNRSATTIISVVYGKQSELQAPDALQTLSNIAHRFTNAMYPGAYAVEILPILDYLPAPLATWKRDAKRDFKKISYILRRYFDDAVKNDTQRSSLCVNLSEDQSELTSVEKSWIAGTISIAALETTSNTLSFFIYAMTLHPNVQQQAQNELDRVVGRSRNPTFSDMPHLPYVRAIVKEVLRWQPAIPLAVPHVSLKDDWYENYFIPKGTSCIANVWSMNRDKDVYGPDADQFRPERFLELSDKGFMLRGEYEADDGHYTYGFGRRVCVGKHVADNALFINICTTLWALWVEPDNFYKPVENRVPLKDLLNPSPDFQCRFIPRFPGAEVVLQSLHDYIAPGTN
ncbi:cytochrome P450 [Rhodocollybia butyracea]|uniref:Cytochrome P450 n=1 Tax=Rhodocollybia butyracea TaxID=206335 RepID=A0A9P5PWH8_9AGAR|nr:cytochrome P450 [Rhodocollybia butyracea]